MKTITPSQIHDDGALTEQTISNFGRISYRFRDIDAQSYRKNLVSPTPPSFVTGTPPLRGNPSEFLDETYRAKTMGKGTMKIA